MVFNLILLSLWLFLLFMFFWSLIDLSKNVEYLIHIKNGRRVRLTYPLIYHGIWIIPLVLSYRIWG